MRDDGEIKNERGYHTTMMIGERDVILRGCCPCWDVFESLGDRRGPSGIAEREDIAILRLGGSKVEVDEEEDPDIEIMDECSAFKFKISGNPLSTPPIPGGSLDDHREVPA